MRDLNFAEVFSEESLKLEKYFRDKLKNYIPRGDKALLAEDLVQQTAMEALLNSRNQNYQDRYDIKTLIWQKAKNIWAEHVNPPKKHFSTENLEAVAEMHSNEPDAHTRMTQREDLEKLRKVSNPLAWKALHRRQDGYPDDEIAKELNLSEVNLRQKIHRLIATIKSRWKNRDEL